MSRVTNYIMQRFNITEEEANETIQELLDEEYEDNAENMLAFYGLDKLIPALDNDMLISIASKYEDFITEDSGELEQRAIENVLGKSVEELQEM